MGAWTLGLGAISIGLCAYKPFSLDGPGVLVLSAPITLAFVLSVILVAKGKKGQESMPSKIPL